MSSGIKERPIVFCEDMVRAILAGKKTQTRRLEGLKKVNRNGNYDYIKLIEFPKTHNKQSRAIAYFLKNNGESVRVVCPYGSVGTQLWVRESFQPAGWDAEYPSIKIYYPSDDTSIIHYIDECDEEAYNELINNVCKELDKRSIPIINEEVYNCSKKEHKPFVRPSANMPRLVSRILLEITSLQIERLQDISDADARAEGMPRSHPVFDRVSTVYGYKNFTQSVFAQSWDFINTSKGYPWLKNPWVWVIKFKRVTT